MLSLPSVPLLAAFYSCLLSIFPALVRIILFIYLRADTIIVDKQQLLNAFISTLLTKEGKHLYSLELPPPSI